ncbi:MAG: PQQ-dependent sugar dehydrogenase, partial [Deltaproteobacteria bacterium]|nr:PQQ-dependent sugar dehydrogenase [Deltaproteobacteria bacterium]
MRQNWKCFIACLLLVGSLAFAGCGSSGTGDQTGGDNSGNGDGSGGGTDNGNNGGGVTPAAPKVAFTPVGEGIAFDLIDLEFLPGAGGESIAIGKGGSVYYLKSGFQVVGSPTTIDTIQDGTERGLLNVVADPLYATNHYVYFYYTVNPAAPANDVNRVERRTVTVNVPGDTFSMSDPQTIIEFTKTGNATNHNGGSLVFMDLNHMAAGVGEGADAPQAQDLGSRLGKIHRFIPSRTVGVGGLDAGSEDNGVSPTEPTTYVRGLRNPFTIVVDDEGDLFLGDVGASSFEEIDCVYQAGENYGWPNCEGDCEPFNIAFQDPLHGYAHGDNTFNNQDPEANPTGAESIMAAAFYQGTQYGGVFTDKLIYNEFFAGWVRLLSLNVLDQVTKDEHIGHLTGLTGLHENPADGLLYGVSLFGDDHIQRMDLVP